MSDRDLYVPDQPDEPHHGRCRQTPGCDGPQGHGPPCYQFPDLFEGERDEYERDAREHHINQRGLR